MTPEAAADERSGTYDEHLRLTANRQVQRLGERAAVRPENYGQTG
jgi:hypothetical protein